MVTGTTLVRLMGKKGRKHFGKQEARDVVTKVFFTRKKAKTIGEESSMGDNQQIPSYQPSNTAAGST